ncbi:hypothetical protein BDN70DRAFT_938851 [Pholiota conissans]|uniref:Uncharacterized protein n=1 Tax=Pholiota conissans TaxID=109636 RepID=A0A9P5YN14_9AGAR|nr:hypothetical protein BDN70DRAFT_938851 [Pholiota conissans]
MTSELIIFNIPHTVSSCSDLQSDKYNRNLRVACLRHPKAEGVALVDGTQRLILRKAPTNRASPLPPQRPALADTLNQLRKHPKPPSIPVDFTTSTTFQWIPPVFPPLSTTFHQWIPPLSTTISSGFHHSPPVDSTSLHHFPPLYPVDSTNHSTTFHWSFH